MIRTALFILLKEYVDNSHTPSKIFIEAVDKWDSKAFRADLKRWLDIVDFFAYERMALYYDKDNISSALYPYIIMETEYEKESASYPNIARLTRSKMNSLGFTDWRNSETPDNCHDYTYMQIDVTDSLFGEIVRYKEHKVTIRDVQYDFSAVLLNCDAIKESTSLVLSTSNQKSVKIDCCKDIKSLYHWLSINRKPQRIYCYNEKHGDCNHTSQWINGTNKRAAQLDSCEEETQILLERSIGDNKRSSLWLFDEKRKKFIYFENQQEERLAFHGYHIVEGDENYENINVEKLKKIQNL